MFVTRSSTEGADHHGESSILEIVRRLFPRESASAIHVCARDFVFHQGNRVEAVHLLTRGSLVLERVDEAGRMVMFGMQKAGTLLGWQDLVDGAVHRNSCQTITSCDLIVVPREPFSRALRENESLLMSLMQQAAAQANSYEEHIFRLSTLDVPERLYWMLCTLADTSDADERSVEVSTPLMKRDIAALVGATPESVSRGLRRLQKMKVAEFTRRNTFTVVPPKK